MDGALRRSWWLVVVGVAAGLVAAAAASFLQPTRYRAETTLVLQRGSQPLAGSSGGRGLVRTFRDLARSDIVASNVIQNLALHESPSSLLDRVSVATDGSSSILRLRVDDADGTRAKQIAQELALVFTQLARERFPQPAGGRAIGVAVFDPAHTLSGRSSPRLPRNLAWGALLGALAGLLAAELRRARPTV